jgi:hypothetical protein
MASPARRHVIVEDFVGIIFEELDYVWLQFTWDKFEDLRDEIIEVLFLVYLT